MKTIRTLRKWLRSWQPVRLGSSPRNLRWLRPRKIRNASRIFIGNDVLLGRNCILKAGSGTEKGRGRIVLGDRLRAGDRLHIVAAGLVEIGNDVQIGPNVFIADTTHSAARIDIPYRQQELTPPAPVRIGRGCRLGVNVVVMPGVTIGEDAIVLPNSVVTRDLPACSRSGGAPARVLDLVDEAGGDGTVSVIIPFFNAERFLFEAVDSVVGQSWNRWEILLVDDGSTDQSATIAEALAKRFPDKVKVLRHPGSENRGSSASRNLALRAARGEFVAFLDADDVWLPGKLEAQVKLLREHPEAGMVYGSTTMWHSWDPSSGEPDRQRALGVSPDQVIAPPGLVTRFLTGEAETPGTCAVLVRRELINRIDGFEDSFPGMYDDQVFFAKFCLRFPVYVESGIRDLYRQHPTSCCHRAAGAGLYHPLRPNPSHRAFLRWLDAYLRTHPHDDPALQSALRRAKAKYRRRWARFASRAGRRMAKAAVSWNRPSKQMEQV